MFDTFTLFVVTIILLEVTGAALLLAWMVSRRARVMLGLAASVPLTLALLLIGLWYAWERGYLAGLNLAGLLIGLVVVVPCSMVVLLSAKLVRAEALLRNVRTSRSGQNLYAPAEVSEAEELEDDLRRAMARSDQLRVFYQPIYHANSRTVAGFEALLRWHHPERGHVAPMNFIPIAEQTDLIVPLGAWVLETACAEAARWPEDWYVSVNLSPVQLEKVQLVRQVRNALERTGLSADRLELEVTEGVLVAAEGGEIARLSELRRAGVRVAIDDFGTGYSSLGYLHQLPFDTIKVDRSFVRNLESDSSAQAIVGTVLELSKRLDREVVAEGVETEAQYDILSSLGCQRVQGWLLGQPMSAEDLFERFMRPPSESKLENAWAEA